MKRYFLLTFILLIIITIPNFAMAVTTGNGWAYDETTNTLTIENDDGLTDWKNNGEGVLSGKVNVQHLVLEEVTTLTGAAFQNYTGLVDIDFGTKIKNINMAAFENCASLENAIIPDTVTYMDGFVFKGCSSLINIKFGTGITEVPTAICDDCISLKAVILSENITKINMWAFENCKDLEKVSIPSKVTQISDYAFNDCISLKVIYLTSEQAPKIDRLAFKNITTDARFYIDDQYYNNYKDSFTAGKIGKLSLEGTDYLNIEKETVGNIDNYTVYHLDGTVYKYIITEGKIGLSVETKINAENGQLEVSYDGGNTWTSLGVVVGKDGKDGSNGKDAVAPQIQINSTTKEWEVSYDEGKTWTSLGVVAEGKDGIDGNDGANGKDGKDGVDGMDGKDATSITTNGKNGKDGKDGITPKMQLNSETGELEVSYDEGKTWTSLGTVVGEDGKDGKDGVNGKDSSITYGSKEYTLIGVLALLAVLGNIGWIVALKVKRK